MGEKLGGELKKKLSLSAERGEFSPRGGSGAHVVVYCRNQRQRAVYGHSAALQTFGNIRGLGETVGRRARAAESVRREFYSVAQTKTAYALRTVQTLMRRKA